LVISVLFVVAGSTPVSMDDVKKYAN